MGKNLLEKQASNFRQDCHFNNDDSLSLRSILIQKNVVTVFKPLKESFSGMAIKVKSSDNSFKRFMLVNTSKSIGHQNFTICHELYHLFIQPNFSLKICDTGLFDNKDEQEYFADIFASHLLVPKGGLIALVPDEELENASVSLKTILKIEHFFCCSRKAILHRLLELQFINQNQFDLYISNVIQTAGQNGYDTKLYKPTEEEAVVGDYGIIARDLYEKGKISESHYISLLLDLGMEMSDIQTPNEIKD
jgi:Zn-dependent peptidase ImmA (M78 family)